MNLGGKGGVKSDINVTPLVDVMLVLLIIMMIIAPMLQKGVDVKLPTATNTTDKPETQDQTVVAVDAPTSRMFPATPRGHRENDLARKVDRGPRNQEGQDRPDQGRRGRRHYGRVMAAMDQLRKAQVEDMGLVTERKMKPGQQGGK